MDATFLQERIDAAKAMVVLYEDAITFLIGNPTQSYKLDTGQSVQDVKRADIPSLQAAYDSVLNRLVVLEARQNGAATVMRPAF